MRIEGKAICKPESRLSPDIECAALDFPIFRTKTPSVWYFVRAAEQTKTISFLHSAINSTNIHRMLNFCHTLSWAKILRWYYWIGLEVKQDIWVTNKPTEFCYVTAYMAVALSGDKRVHSYLKILWNYKHSKIIIFNGFEGRTWKIYLRKRKGFLHILISWIKITAIKFHTSQIMENNIAICKISFGLRRYLLINIKFSTLQRVSVH